MTVADPPITPQPCTPADLPALIAMVDSVLRAGSDQSLLTDYPLVYRENNLANIHLIKVNGTIAAEAPFIPRPVWYGPCRFTVGIISPTATHPDHRKRGFGLSCVNACIEKMTADGVELSVLWTLERTFPFYEHAGFQAVRPMTVEYHLRRSEAERFATGSFSIIQADSSRRDHLDAIRAMHDAESFGVLRTADEWPCLLSLPKMHTMLACRGEVPLAYLVVSFATNKPGLIEGGGEVHALASLVNHALRTWPDEGPIHAYGYVRPTRLGDLLESVAADRRQPPAENMMVRVNHLHAVLKQIAPANAATLDPDTPRRELASLIFGEHPARRLNRPAGASRPCHFDLPIPILDRS